jgi:hypothetical protein
MRDHSVLIKSVLVPTELRIWSSYIIALIGVARDT